MGRRVCANGALCEGWRPSGAPGAVRDYNVYVLIERLKMLSGERQPLGTHICGTATGFYHPS